MKKHIHFIGIGGIGVSALARYYQSLGYRVTGSDSTDSHLLKTLRSEGVEVFIGTNPDIITPQTEKVIYSEAIITKPDLPKDEQITAHPEIQKAISENIVHISYPVALGEIFNGKKGIAVTGSHGKSTTTAMMAIVLKNASIGGSAIVGTQVPQLENSNFYADPESDIFVIEACEYKRSFLNYHSFITIITNIDLDHLDYYKNLDDYLSAFQTLVDQTSGFVIISSDDKNSQKLIIPKEKKIVVGDTIQYFAKIEDLETGETKFEPKTLEIPKISLQVPGEHILQDARLVYAACRLLGIPENEITEHLGSYHGSWRRSEVIRTTQNGNILMSDYGHHPHEIIPTLHAIHDKYPDKTLFVVFQSHQYSRTRELLDGFATAFSDADILLIPNIYFSRDKKEDVEWMTTEHFIQRIAHHHPNVSGGQGLENALETVLEYDRMYPNSSIILLLWAGDVDTLRDKIS